MSAKHDRDAARWLAEETRRCGGRLRLSGATLLSLFLAGPGKHWGIRSTCGTP
jgi:hypothetical protein